MALESSKEGQNEVVSSDKKAPSSLEIPQPSAQHGVQAIEATTSAWSKRSLICAYVFIWLIYFIASTQEVIVRTLEPFVTSSFALHSLTPSTNTMASIIGGLSKLPLSKILDIWGRPQGMSVTLIIWVCGFVMMAACHNVHTFAAAKVFAAVGAQGVSYCLTVFIADTTSLKNRGLMLSFATSPYIVTTWIGGPISDSILHGPGWRWGFGILAIVLPAVVCPIIVLFFIQLRKAKKAGYLPETKSEDSWLKSVWKYVIEVDLLGLVILMAGMALFLLPFSLYSYQNKSWNSPMIISMIIVGGLLIVAFILYEKFGAPVKFIEPRLLSDRTVFFGGLMFFFVFSCSAVWGGYFTSMLLIVWGQTVQNTTYISNIYRVGSCFSALIIGYFIRQTRRFKWVALYYALPLMSLGVGLMIHFRQPDNEIGYIIMTQIFVAFSGGPIVIAGELAMMAPSDHQNIAVIIAILDLFGSVGTAVGYSVSTAIWTGNFRRALEKYLPEGAPIEHIYGSIYSQLAYPMGSEIRNGIAQAYGYSQRFMLITSMSLLGGAFISVFLWRNIKLDKKQTNGLVI